MFEKRLLRRIFGPERKDAREHCIVTIFKI
jgi:hypothetical protein